MPLASIWLITAIVCLLDLAALAPVGREARGRRVKFNTEIRKATNSISIRLRRRHELADDFQAARWMAPVQHFSISATSLAGLGLLNR